MAETNIRTIAGRIADLYNKYGGELTPPNASNQSLNDILDPDDEQPGPGRDLTLANKLAGRKMGWFMVGNGKSSGGGIKYTDNNLKKPLPIRYMKRTEEEGFLNTDQNNDNYRLRKVITIGDVKYVAYYAKKLDLGNNLLVKIVNSGVDLDREGVINGLPNYTVGSDSAGIDRPILTAVTMKISLEGKDVKDYFIVGDTLAERGDKHSYTNNLIKIDEVGYIIAKDVDFDHVDGGGPGKELQFAELGVISNIHPYVFTSPDSSYEWTLLYHVGGY